MLLTIKYTHLYGGSFYDRRWWTAIEPNGDVYDYHKLDVLKKSIVEDGHTYQVVRQHKDGSTTVLEKSST